MVAIVEKAKNAGISLYPGEIQRLKARSRIRDGGSPTRYVRRLMEADEQGKVAPTAYDEAILEKLAVTYFGYHAPKFTCQLRALRADQPELLHRLLQQLSETMACGAEPDQIAVVPTWSLPADHPQYQPLPDGQPLLAAEAPAKWGAWIENTVSDPVDQAAADALAKARKGKATSKK